MYNNSALLQAKVLEYWSPAPLPEGDPGKDAAAPAELRQPAEEEAEFSSDSFVGSEPEVEITGASGQPRSQEDPTVEGWVGGGAADAEELDPKGDEQGPGGDRQPRPPLRWGRHRPAPKSRRRRPRCWANCAGEVTPPRAGSGTPPAAPLKLKFPLRRSGG